MVKRVAREISIYFYKMLHLTTKPCSQRATASFQTAVIIIALAFISNIVRYTHSLLGYKVHSQS